MPDEPVKAPWYVELAKHGVTPSLILLAIVYAIWQAAPWCGTKIDKFFDAHVQNMETQATVAEAQAKTQEKMQESQEAAKVAVETIAETIKVQAENSRINADTNVEVKKVLETSTELLDKVSAEQKKHTEILDEIKRKHQ